MWPALLNVGLWMWFPWRYCGSTAVESTRRKILPADAAEFYGILLTMSVLLLLIVGALSGPLWFGIAGTAVFAAVRSRILIVRRHVREAAVKLGLFARSRGTRQAAPPAERSTTSNSH